MTESTAAAAPSRRQQLLDIAADLFARRGFHGVSVTDLGAAAGISGPALYKHFTSKDAILAEMLISISEELLTVGRARAASATDVRGSLAALVDWHVDFALSHKPLIIVQDRDWSSLPDEARERVRGLQRDYVELWATTLQELHPTLTLATARASVHATFGLIGSRPAATGRRMKMRIRNATVLAFAVGTLAAGSHLVVAGAAPSVAPGVDRPSTEASVEQIYQEVFVSTDEDARRAREDAQTSQYQECLKSQGVWDLPEADWGDEEQNLAHQCDDSVYGQDLAVQDATLEYQIETRGTDAPGGARR